MTTLQPFIHQQFKWPVWRMEIDEISNLLFVELRNGEEKNVAFGCVDLNTGTLNFDDFTTEERWLTGIETAFDGTLLIHNYQSQTGPVHKGPVAIDG